MNIAGLFSEKIRKTARGSSQTILFINHNTPPFPKKKVIWMHCASLGEFEQGRVILEKFRSSYPEWKIAVSFFSSSGYEIRQNWPGADFIFYLPKDSPSYARKLIQWLTPSMCILVKYDFWWNYLRELEKQKIPVYLIAAHFDRSRYYFRQPFLALMQSWNQIFTMRASSEEFLYSLGFNNVTTTGDPRLDRVISIREKGLPVPEKITSLFQKYQKIYVYGSVYPEDIDVIGPSILARSSIFHVVVPHDIRPANVEQILLKLERKSDVYSREISGKNILIIDEVGYLAGIYAYAAFVYIGGGFGNGIHNILEPAVFGIPVVFGPRHSTFPEARELIQEGACASISGPESFVSVLSVFEKNQIAENISPSPLPKYFQKHAGASDKIISGILHQNFPE